MAIGINQLIHTEIHTADVKCIFGHMCLLFVILYTASGVPAMQISK